MASPIRVAGFPNPEEARQHMADGQFAPGSMLPKVEAAVSFAESAPTATP